MTADAYDAIVIGAGPSGSTAAYACARAGLRTVLFEKSVFPRDKVCGGCLGARGVGMLRDLGLGRALDRVSISEMRALTLRSPRSHADIPVDPGRIVGRHSFDAALADEAHRAGAEFRDGASVETIQQHSDRVALTVRTPSGRRETVTARTVLNASGLSKIGSECGNGPRVARESRIGVAALVSDATTEYEPDVTHMHVIPDGYAGVVRLDGSTLNIACAVDPRATRDKGITEFVRTAFRSTGAPIPQGLEDARWTGTPALTRRRDRAAHGRVLNLGDAAGYVEPFTGEGMTWAIAGGAIAADLVARWCDREDFDLASAYQRAHRRAISRRWRSCRLVRAAIRRPIVTDAAIRLASASSMFTRLAAHPFERPYDVAGVAS